MFKPTNILVPTDFSEYSDKALAQALDIAKQYGAKVYLLHVIHEEIHQCVVDYCLTEEQMEQIRTQMVTGPQESMKKQVARFPIAKEVEVITEVKTGLPYEAILEEAQKKGIDLIVIGSLGRSGIAKYIIGSVARNVLKGASCPVLLTK